MGRRQAVTYLIPDLLKVADFIGTFMKENAKKIFVVAKNILLLASHVALHQFRGYTVNTSLCIYKFKIWSGTYSQTVTY